MTENDTKEEMSVLDEMLSYATMIHRAEVNVAFMDRPLMIYWTPLTKEENAEFFSFDEGDIDAGTMLKHQIEINTKRTWAMIDKAQKTGEVPDENVITEDGWNQLGESYPETRLALIGTLMNAMGATVKVFPSGRQRAKPR